MKVLIDTSPLESGHAIRGIGTYTRLLTEFLEKEKKIQVARSKTKLAESFEPDIVHYPYFDLFFSTLPLIRKKPTVVTVHDVIPLKFPEYYSPGVRGKAKFIKQKSALRTVEAIITDSESSKADIHQYLGIPLNKIHVVYLAAHPDLKPVSKEKISVIARKYQLPKKYVLYVGDINYNKNIPQLIKAARDLPRYYKLVCLGQAFKPQEIKEWHWIETQLALSDVQDKVKFLTDVPGGAIDELAAIYSGADCYVQPSFYEGFGLPVLEAMQTKTPVVSTNTSSLPEVVGDYGLLVEPHADELAKAINQVLAWSKAKKTQVVSKAFKWARSFTWQKTARETIRVYQGIRD